MQDGTTQEYKSQAFYVKKDYRIEDTSDERHHLRPYRKGSGNHGSDFFFLAVGETMNVYKQLYLQKQSTTPKGCYEEVNSIPDLTNHLG